MAELIPLGAAVSLLLLHLSPHLSSSGVALPREENVHNAVTLLTAAQLIDLGLAGGGGAAAANHHPSPEDLEKESARAHTRRKVQKANDLGDRD